MAYNPFASWKITGSWEAHMSYSAGGEDYPLPYGTPLPAPAPGRLYVSGYPPAKSAFFEFQCGSVGSAGRRSILMLDTPIRDVVAVVFQHQSRFGDAKNYAEREILGWSGASANGKDWGGDVHLHIHCLTTAGRRRKFTDYFSGASAAGDVISLLEAFLMAAEDDVRRGADALTYGIEGVKFDGDMIKESKLNRQAILGVADVLREMRDILKTIKQDTQRAADAVTNGIEGVKHNGDVINGFNRLADLIEQDRAETVNPVQVGEELASNPKFLEQVSSRVAELVRQFTTTKK